MNELRISDIIANCIETEDLQVTHTSYCVASQTRVVRVMYTRDDTRYDIMIRPASTANDHQLHKTD